MGENSNIEQPVEPMSNVEAILRGEDVRPMSRIEALLKEGGGGGGTTVVANPSGTATANLNKLQVGSSIYSVGGLEIIGTLEAGETTLTIQNNAITTTATYDFFTDTFGVSPTEVEVETGQLTLTFDEQEADVSVKVRIS